MTIQDQSTERPINVEPDDVGLGNEFFESLYNLSFSHRPSYKLYNVMLLRFAINNAVDQSGYLFVGLSLATGQSL